MNYKRFLLQGAYGEVRKATHKISNTSRAIKIISKNNTSPED